MPDNVGTATAPPPQATPNAGDAASKTPAAPAAAPAAAAAPVTGSAGTEGQKPVTLLGTEAAKPIAEAPKAEEKPAEKADYSKLKLPEGAMLKPADVDAVKAFAEKHKLPLEAAQSVLDERNGAVKGYHESLLSSHTQQVEANKKLLQAHPVYGGDHLKATDAAMTGIMKRFGSEKLMQQVLAGGFNWNPDFADFLMKVHEATKEDKLVTTNQTKIPAPKSFEDMYQNGKGK